MKEFIGIKRITAKPMTRGEFNAYYMNLSADKDGAKAGYLVEYTDGGKSNHGGHENYISWSPKDVFEAAYQSTEAMNFSAALTCMKDRQRIAREGWNGKDMFVFLAYSHPVSASEAVTITIEDYVVMRTADGKFIPWTPSVTDILANDWQTV